MKEKEETTGLEKAVMGWLTTKGYPLEMLTSKAFLGRQIGVRHGWYYDDPETGKPRELDLLTSNYVVRENILLFQFIVECKRSLDPFVAFTYGELLAKSMNEAWVPSNPLGRALLERLTRLQIDSRLPIYGPTSPIAYSMTQAHVTKLEQGTKRTDKAFEALMGVTKGSYSLSKLFSEKVTRVSGSNDPGDLRPVAFVGYPLIVTDAPMFSCSLGEDNEPTLKRIGEIVVEWSFPPVGTLMITVISISKLDSLISRYLQSFAVLDFEADTILRALTP